MRAGFVIKHLLIGLSMAGLLAGGVVSISIGQEQEQGVTLGPQDAVILLAYAVTCSDVLLLANDGIITGAIQDEAFTLALEEGGGSRTFSREEIDTILLATPGNGRLKDRIILRSGEIFQGELLQVETFQVELDTGEDIALPKAQLQGAVLATTEEACGGEGPMPLGDGKLEETIERLINNSLTPGLVNSLSKYDWVLLSNQGILSGSVCDEQFNLEMEGQAVQLAKEELIGILLGRIDLVVLKKGPWLEGDLSKSELCLVPVYQQDQTQLAHETLRGVIFKAILSGGGPG